MSGAPNTTPKAPVSAPAGSFNPVRDSGAGDSSGGGRGGGSSATDMRAQQMADTVSARAPKPRLGGLFRGYQPTGARVSYAENKVGVLPNMDGVVQDIAIQAGVDTSVAEDRDSFLEAIVTDVYVNAYSDKYTFEGEVVLDNGFSLERRHIKTVVAGRVGTNNRRYARGLAPTVVAVMRDNPAFYDLLDARASKHGVTRAEALYLFDGAEALTGLDRSTAIVLAEVKALTLRHRNDSNVYDHKVGVVSADGRVGGVDTAAAFVGRAAN